MLDFYIMDAAIGQSVFFSIDEPNMLISMCYEHESSYYSFAEYSPIFYSREIASYPLGENLFSFLSIPDSKLKKVRSLILEDETWNELHEKDNISQFMASMDCVYLYLLFYSYNRGRIANENSLQLERLSKEFEFALNFCCNDNYIPEFKALSSIQRYYLYCQLYLDNTHTINRHYQQNNYLFIDSDQRIKELDALPRMQKTTNHYGQPIDSFEPITTVPDIPAHVIAKLASSKILPSFRYGCDSLHECLMEELYSLITLNVRVKKCKNCGKYFIPKGGYVTDYCDRIPNGENTTCKRIAAIKTRKQKVNDNPILREYQKAYKRMYARVTNKKITHDDFLVWSNKAAMERDRAAELYKTNSSEQIIKEFKGFLGNK